MKQISIFFPVVAMFILTCFVAATLLSRRIAFYKSNRIHPQKTATAAQMAATIPDSRAADNFRNLFELPVLFYVAVLILYSTQLVCMAQLVFAWGYVIARYTHSFIHCGSNVVMHRFYAYLASCFFLLCMWGMLTWQLLNVA